MNLDWQTVGVVVGAAAASAATALGLVRRRRTPPTILLAPDDQPRVITRKEWHEHAQLVDRLVWEMDLVKRERINLAERVEDLQKETVARLDAMADEERERYDHLIEEIGKLRVDLATRGRA